MAIILWIIVGVAAAIVINMFRGHNTLLNTVAAHIGALGAGGGYALYVKASDLSIYSALTQLNWSNFLASVIGAVGMVIIAQLFTLERHEYITHQ